MSWAASTRARGWGAWTRRQRRDHLATRVSRPTSSASSPPRSRTGVRGADRPPSARPPSGRGTTPRCSQALAAVSPRERLTARSRSASKLGTLDVDDAPRPLHDRADHVRAPLLTFAPARFARDDGGQGWFGETNDQNITNVMFIMIAFFPTVILVLSLIQWRLDKRKHARLDAAKGRGATPTGAAAGSR